MLRGGTYRPSSPIEITTSGTASQRVVLSAYAGEQPVYQIPGEESALEYIPLGVGAIIPPWNFPLAIMVGMIGAAPRLIARFGPKAMTVAGLALLLQALVLPLVNGIAAIIERDGAYLVTRRPAGVHLEGLWEFPGGKCDEGESLETCLTREIREELGSDATVGSELFTTTHTYPERRVQLHFFACSLLSEPRGVLGQEMRWVPKSELRLLNFPPADAELIALLAR